MSYRSEREETEYGGLIVVGVLVTLAAATAMVPVAGAAAAWVSGGGWAWPSGHVLDTLTGLVGHAHDPATAYPRTLQAAIPGPGLFWTVVGVAEGLLVFTATLIAVAVVARHTPAGMISRPNMKKAMKKIASTPCAPYGTYRGVKVKPRAEDAALIVAPQQSGKTTRVAVGRIKDAPGAVVATSTKSDLVDLTLFTRVGEAEDRTAFVFDPDRVTGWPNPTRWNIVTGCHIAKEATQRAGAMVAARPLGQDGGGNIKFFEGQAKIVLRCLLHAAALEDLTMAEVLSWARDFANDTPHDILQSHPRALPGWADDLRKATRGEARETIQSTAMTLAGATEALTDPNVLAMVCPTDEDPGFDVDRFVARGRDTLYVLSEGGDHVSTAPLVTAFVSAIIAAGRRRSQHSPSRKLDPMLTFVLDELANVAPIPELGMLLSDGGGRGMSTWALVQSFGQLRARWGRDGFDTMWGASSLKLLLPGCTEGDDLERISRGIGDRWLRETTVSNNGWLGGGSGSTSKHWRSERAMPADAITQMEDGTGLLIYKNVGNAVIELPAWWQRPDKDEFAASEQKMMELTGRKKATAA